MEGHGRQQTGDPTKLADALVKLAVLENPPLRFAAGFDAVAALKAKDAELLTQAEAHLELSSHPAHDDD